MMAPLLALLEGISIFAAAGGALVISAHHPVAGWADGVSVVVGAAGLSLSFLVAFSLADLYSPRVILSFDALLGRVPRAFTAAFLLVAVFSLLVPSARITADAFESSALLAILVVFGPVLPLRSVYRYLRSHYLVEHLLIVGASSLARSVIEEIKWRPDVQYAVVDSVDGDKDLAHVIGATRPDRIVVAVAGRRERLPVYRLVESLARGIVVEEVAETYERLTGKMALEALAPDSVIFSRDFRRSRWRDVLARALSFVASVMAFILVAPLLGLIALLVKLDSRGPVFFVNERVGLSGRAFKLIKFRTMRPADRPIDPWETWEGDNRERITRVGRWLRRFRDGHSLFDELPQLINVLRGDMNLVGPRPHTATDLEMYILAARNLSEVSGDAIPYYSVRCSVRPGMTGWATVRRGYANSLDEEMEKIRYDLYYIKHRSFWLDLVILFETVKMFLPGGGETGPAARPVDAGGREGLPAEAPAPILNDGHIAVPVGGGMIRHAAAVLTSAGTVAAAHGGDG